jgi:hypothetical protein
MDSISGPHAVKVEGGTVWRVEMAWRWRGDGVEIAPLFVP